MGFLSFFKGKKKNKLEYLDVPPLPPDKGYAEFPELPELPELEESFSKSDELRTSLEPKEPRYEEVPKPKEFEVPKPFPRKVEMPPIDKDVSEPEFEPKLKTYEPEGPKEEKDLRAGPTFIKVSRFKEILKDISTIRVGLRDSSNALSKVEDIDENIGRCFEKWHSSLMDLQKKLIYIDKTLFKR